MADLGRIRFGDMISTKISYPFPSIVSRLLLIMAFLG